MSNTEIFTKGQRVVIVNQLNKARAFILVAVAYFTDVPLFNLLVKKAKEGVLVQLIVKDDEVNIYSAINFDALNTVGGDFSFNKVVHHKFCVIDGVTVLSGSYNWTNQARLNHEDLTLIQGDILTAAELTVQFFNIKDPLRTFRKASLQNKKWRDESDLSSDSKREERRSGINKKIQERRERRNKDSSK